MTTQGAQDMPSAVVEPNPPRLAERITAGAATVACIAVCAVAVMFSFVLFVLSATLNSLDDDTVEPVAQAAREATCLIYYDFVRERAAEGLMPEQIESLVRMAQKDDPAERTVMALCGRPSAVLSAS